MSNYLFISAHPDDVEISAMGFMLSLLRQGHTCHMMVCCGNDNDRQREQQDVFEDIHLKHRNFCGTICPYLDGNLEGSVDLIRNDVENKIRDNKIDVVVSHFPKDTHRDHRAVAQACIDAARTISLIQFESPNVYEFEPNFYVPLTQEDLDQKILLMQRHTSQNLRTKNFYLDKIRAMAAYRGQAVYEQYAEAFHIHRLKAK